MPRAHVVKTLRTPTGDLITGATISVLTANGATQIEESLYTAAAGNEVYSNPFVSVTGIVDFYLALPTRVRLKVTLANDGGDVFFEDVDVLVPVDTVTASQVGFTPTGGLLAEQVQAALEELDSEKSPVGHGHAAPSTDTHDGAGIDSTQVGTNATATGNKSTAIGDDSLAAALDDTVVGADALTRTGGKRNTVIGTRAASETVGGTFVDDTVAVGADVQALATRGTVVGFGAAVLGVRDTALGYAAGNSNSGGENTALGSGASTSGTQNVAVGDDAQTAVGVDRAFALGAGAVATADDQGVLKADVVEVKPSSTTNAPTVLRLHENDGETHDIGVTDSTVTFDGIALALSGSGVESTVGAGLPSFSGRMEGDLHYDQTAHREFVVTGVIGTTVRDSFTRANGTLGGSTTESGGEVWSVDNNALVQVEANRVRFLSGSGLRSAHISVTGTAPSRVKALITPGGANGVYLKVRSAGGAGDGYALQIKGDQTYSVLRAGNGATGGTGSTSGSTGGTTSTAEVEVIGSGAATTIYWRVNGVTVYTFVDPTPLIGTIAGANGGSNEDNYFDNFEYDDLGTLTWQQVEPIYLTDRAPGAQVVTANAIPPGIRVPAATTARDLIARLDTPATGSSFIVVFERWNNGAFANNIGTVTIPATESVASTTGLSVGLAKGDIIKANVTQVGSTVAGSDLLVSVDCY